MGSGEWHTRAGRERKRALKFERFIFDVLPLAHRSVTVYTSRKDEFAPLKNATGADSPEVVRKAISDLAAKWIKHAGGTASGTVEINPLTALEAEDLKVKAATKQISGLI